MRHNDTRFLAIYDAKIQALLQEVEDGGILLIEAEEKIGFDGATGNALYNQKFDLQNSDKSDASLLSTCLVPLQYQTANGDAIITNPVPQGATFCQPVRLEYRKETKEASKEIHAWIQEEMASLSADPIVIQVGSKAVQFRHTLRPTMLDVKAKNAVTDTASTLRCFICNATSSDFNRVDDLAQKHLTKKERLIYGGVCDLHAWPRAFEAINSLSDKLTIKKWKAMKPDDRKVVEERKKVRQQKFKDELGLLVDVPKAGGVGNSNTGNVARRAFQNEQAFSNITGVDEELIHGIHTMLICLNVDHQIHREKFKQKGIEVAKRWVEMYSWYNMPVTVHQLLFHAWESLDLSTLPISYFSEQSLESTNKYFKKDREHHSRKDSRLHTIQDQFHRQSDKSDLAIALKIHEKHRKKSSVPLPPDVLELLMIDVVESTEELEVD